MTNPINIRRIFLIALIASVSISALLGIGVILLGNFGYIEAPGFDLSVTIDGNLFETRLSEWSAILSEILE